MIDHIKCFAQIDLEKDGSARGFLLVESVSNIKVEVVEGRYCGMLLSKAMLYIGYREVFIKGGEDEPFQHFDRWAEEGHRSI